MKEMNRRTFLKLSGASAVMLALAACDDSCSSGSTSSGSATETPPSPPIPVIRDGQKILTIFNAELARRKVENIKFEYSKGLEHAIQADVQMFVDNGSPEFPAEEGLRLRMEGDYAAKMWEGLHEAGYSSGSTASSMQRATGSFSSTRHTICPTGPARCTRQGLQSLPSPTPNAPSAGAKAA